MAAFGVSLETSAQSPTSWPFLIFAFGAPIAPSASKASPKTVVAEIASMLRRFMISSLCDGSAPIGLRPRDALKRARTEELNPPLAKRSAAILEPADGNNAAVN